VDAKHNRSRVLDFAQAVIQCWVLSGRVSCQNPKDFQCHKTEIMIASPAATFLQEAQISEFVADSALAMKNLDIE
jgi:hypothetical protein